MIILLSFKNNFKKNITNIFKYSSSIIISSTLSSSSASCPSSSQMLSLSPTTRSLMPYSQSFLGRKISHMFGMIYHYLNLTLSSSCPHSKPSNSHNWTQIYWISLSSPPEAKDGSVFLLHPSMSLFYEMDSSLAIPWLKLFLPLKLLEILEI